LKAGTLIEAMGYIQRFRNRTVLIKIGGSIMDNADALMDMLTDVAFLSTVGLRPIIVHGGGKAISEAMEIRGLKVQFVQGRRYTDQRTLMVVEHVLCNEINSRLVAYMEKLGANAMGLHTLGSCVLFGQKLFLKEDDRQIDLGLVGEVTSVNGKLISLLCESDTIPILAPLARDKTGAKLNCNADTAAGRVAAELKVSKLVFVSDTHGIRQKPDDPDSLATMLKEPDIRTMIDKGIISGGMLPKVEACLEALSAGVEQAHIIDGQIPHSLLLEIFTERGIGTMIGK